MRNNLQEFVNNFSLFRRGIPERPRGEKVNELFHEQQGDKTLIQGIVLKKGKCL